MNWPSQFNCLAKKRSNLLTFYLVLAVKLLDEKLAVAENRQFLSPNLFCGFEGLYDSSIFSYVVSSLA